VVDGDGDNVGPFEGGVENITDGIGGLMSF